MCNIEKHYVDKDILHTYIYSYICTRFGIYISQRYKLIYIHDSKDHFFRIYNELTSSVHITT